MSRRFRFAALTMAAAGAALAAGGAAAGTPARPVRVVSLNLCADELVLRLADRDQVAAVTDLARVPRGSTVAAEAARRVAEAQARYLRGEVIVGAAAGDDDEPDKTHGA